MSDVQIAVIDQQDTQIVLAVPGVQGATGSSIPSGGTADQVLRKNSSTNYDANWSQVTSAMIADGTIVNADVNNGAAIAGTKISPDFGGQAVTTTGQVNAARVNVTANTAPSNGIYLPASNTVAVATNGTGRLFVDASGRVGVGTTSPASGRALTLDNASNYYGLELQVGGTSIGSLIQESTGLLYLGTTTAGGALVLRSGNQAEAARIDSSGRLGIGTSSPGFKLTIEDSATPRIRIGDGVRHLNVDGGSASQNAAIGTDYSGSFGIYTNGAANTRLHITSAGLVGIGTTDARGVLRLAGSSANAFPNNGGLLWLTDTNAATDYKNWSVSSINGDFGVARGSDAFNTGQNAYKITGSATQGYVGEHIWYTNNSSEKVRISNSGQLLVGTSSALSGPYWTNLANLQVAGSYGVGHFATFVNSTSGAGLVFQKSRNASVGGNTIVSNNDLLMDISIEGNDGTGFKQAAVIQCQVDGTPGANDMPGRLVFSVTADGASSPTEAMRIKNSRILNFANTPTYADNTAAKAGGLVDGDVYRKSDGTLMIVYT
jgi:hypothetical protein